jgi:hypothetical protein
LACATNKHNYQLLLRLDELQLTPTIDQNPSLAEAPLEYASPGSLAVAASSIGVLWTILSGALAAAVLLWVALFNGYPTIFSDTGSYLLTGAFHVAFAPFRAPGYSVFIRMTSLGKSPWFTVAAQAILAVYVLRETCNHLIGGGRKFVNLSLLAAVCALVALTSLPWLVSLLMPDVFAGIAFLCIFVLAFAGELPRVQRILLAAILTISVAAHTSLFPITVLFILAVVILRFGARQSHELPQASSVLAWLLVPILAAGFWTASQNQELGLGFRLSPSGNAFLLGRLFGDGLAADFLHENCPKRQFISCRYLSDLPRTEGEFLFWHPLYRDLMKGNPREIDTIVRGTLDAYPRKFILSSAKQTFLQLASLRTGDELRTYAAHDWNNQAMLRVFPGDLQGFESSRQFRGRMLSMPDTVSPFHTTIFWLSLVLSLAFAWAARFARVNKFLASAILFLVINAAVCGALAGVYDRYQSRVAWIIPFCLITYICNLIAERSRGVARQNSPALASFDLIGRHAGIVRVWFK